MTLTRGKTTVVDMFEDVDEAAVKRRAEAARVDRAIDRTRRLLQSSMAADDDLRLRWEAKLRNQKRQLMSLCR